MRPLLSVTVAVTVVLVADKLLVAVKETGSTADVDVNVSPLRATDRLTTVELCDPVNVVGMMGFEWPTINGNDAGTLALPSVMVPIVTVGT